MFDSASFYLPLTQMLPRLRGCSFRPIFEASASTDRYEPHADASVVPIYGVEPVQTEVIPIQHRLPRVAGQETETAEPHSFFISSEQ